jgi:hypothetical protein
MAEKLGYFIYKRIPCQKHDNVSDTGECARCHGKKTEVIEIPCYIGGGNSVIFNWGEEPEHSTEPLD